MEDKKKLYIETYGCQMNVADSEVVVAVLEKDYQITESINDADLILVNTCSIRENAEQRVWGRLDVFRHEKKKRPDLVVGIIGCMAERLKEDLLQKGNVDIVVGPDSYRELPSLVNEAETGQKAINVLLSREETYDDISPVRINSNGISAFISIMRGCENYCSYCIVPYVRGKERSRDPKTILQEIKDLSSRGFREVTLLGQNVNSYLWKDGEEDTGFAKLLELSAQVDPELRIRFATSHPKDMSDEVLHTMAKFENICKCIHLPFQSGSTNVLKTMNRKYTREWYMDRISAIRNILPDCAVSTDIMVGFSGETEEDHNDTLSLMDWAEFDFAYMFRYSERPGTFADKKLPDDVEDEVKARRLNEVIQLQNKISERVKNKDVGKVFRVLVEGESRKSNEQLSGRNSQNKVVVFPRENFKKGDYVDVLVEKCTSATLIGRAVTK